MQENVGDRDQRLWWRLGGGLVVARAALSAPARAAHPDWVRWCGCAPGARVCHHPHLPAWLEIDTRARSAWLRALNARSRGDRAGRTARAQRPGCVRSRPGTRTRPGRRSRRGPAAPVGPPSRARPAPRRPPPRDESRAPRSAAQPHAVDLAASCARTGLCLVASVISGGFAGVVDGLGDDSACLRMTKESTRSACGAGVETVHSRNATHPAISRLV
jgi:hypothetical protein